MFGGSPPNWPTDARRPGMECASLDLWHLLWEIVVLLGAALVAGGLCSRFGQSPLVGYLLAGMLLGGPGSFRVVHAEKDIETIAELGVSLLLFSLGLEFSWTRLVSLGSSALGSGVVQVLATAGLGTGVAFLFQLPLTEAIAVGAMVALSSTAGVLRVLMDRAEIDSPHGRHAVAILLVQDMAVVPLAVLMTVLAGEGTVGAVLWDVGRIALLALGLIVGLYLLLNKIAVRALGQLTLERNRELTILLAVVTGLGAAVAAHQVGISPALGAFVAGMFLGNSPFATQIRADVSSLRVVLLTLFFGAAGMVADPLWIARHWYLVAGVTALILACKAALIWTILRLQGRPDTTAMATGVCLSQIGEFAFVLGSVGREEGVVSEETHLVVVSAAIASLFATPYLIALAPRIGAWFGLLLRRKPLAPISHKDRSQEDSPEIVIIGFGPAGRAVAENFLGQNRCVLVLDLNPEAKRSAEGMGFHGEVGDARLADVLEHIHLTAARIVVITVPHHTAALTILHHVRRLAPHVTTLARSRYQRHTHELQNAGAKNVIGDEEEVAQALCRAVRAHLGDEPSP